MNPVVNDLDISCLPADLPEFIEVDLSGLKKGMSLHLNDITLPKGVKAVTHGKPNPVLVSVVTPRPKSPRRDGRRRHGSRRPLRLPKPRPPGQGRQGRRRQAGCQACRQVSGSPLRSKRPANAGLFIAAGDNTLGPPAVIDYCHGTP